MMSINDEDNVGGLGVVRIKWTMAWRQNDIINGGRGHMMGGGRRMTMMMMMRTTKTTIAVPHQSYTFTNKLTSLTTLSGCEHSQTSVSQIMRRSWS